MRLLLTTISQEAGWDSAGIAKSHLFMDQQRMYACREAKQRQQGVVGSAYPTQGHSNSDFLKRHCAGNNYTSCDVRLTWIQTQVLPLLAMGPRAS